MRNACFKRHTKQNKINKIFSDYYIHIYPCTYKYTVQYRLKKMSIHYTCAYINFLTTKCNIVH